MKKKHIDFIIDKNNDQIIKLRFYPRQSHVHGFEDNSPDNWKSVYKIYYSWVIYKIKSWAEFGEPDNYEKVFDMSWDECSALANVGQCLRYVIDKKKKYYNLKTLGQPGSDWEFRYRKTHDWIEGNEDVSWSRTPENDYVEIAVWNNCSNKGYRFYLNLEGAENFIKFIEEVNEHMLENSEPC